jgi:hypothetical protein
LRRCRDQAVVRFRIAKAAGVELTTEELMRALAKREDLSQEWTAFCLEVAGVWKKAAKDIAAQLVNKDPAEIQSVLTNVCREGLRRLARGGRVSKRTNKRKED